MELKQDLGMQYPTPTSSRKYKYGIYVCPICSKELRAQQRYSAQTKACMSCASTTKNLTHGASKTRLHNIWRNMKNRCNTSITKHKSHQRYVDNGITVCEEWKTSYEVFAKWAINNGYTDSLSIDRIDSLKGYYPDNCRWATCATQAQNTIAINTTNTTGYRGVHKNRNRKKFGVQIRVNNKRIWLGAFSSALEGARAYDKYIIDNKLSHTINNV